MTQLTKGARRILDAIAAELADARAAAELGRSRTRYNPAYTEDRLGEIVTALDRAEERLSDLEPLLMRQSPQIEKRMADLETRVERLEHQRVIPLAARQGT